MTIDRATFEDRISRALRFTAERWWKQQESALTKIIDGQPQFRSMPSIFQSAAWLNTGLDAVVTLFPAVAPRLILPVAVAKVATSIFQQAYADESQRINAVVQGEHGKIRDKFLRELGESATHLPSAPFGQEAKAALISLLDQRRLRDEFASSDMLQAHVESMLQHHQYGVIETGRSEIQARTEAGVQPLLTKLRAVYRGSHLSPGGVLWRLDPSRESCYTHFSVPIKQYDPIRGGRVSCGPERSLAAGSKYVTPANKARFDREVAWILSNIWSLEVHADVGFGSPHATWVWPAPAESTAIVDLARTYEKRLPEDFRASLEQADRAQWPETRRRAGRNAA
ncbi:MAG: hypothetical protein WDZ65_08795 [Aquisalimonadaceae bacterium]